MNKFTLSITIFFLLTSLFALPVYARTWTETTFADFADGKFDAGGNIFASADGKLKLTGQQWDLNNDGFLDIVFSNARDDKSYQINSYIYWGSAGGFSSGNKTELPTQGSYGNSVADLNGDGFLDIVFSNRMGVTSSNTNSVIYWGSVSGFSSGNKTELPTHGAYTNSIADLNGDGFLDIVFSNQDDVTSYNINSVIYWGSASGFSSGNKTELPTHGGVGSSVADLNGDGFLDIVFNNAYDGTSFNINSVIYWGSASGFSSGNKTELPTHDGAGSSVADLNGDGFLDIVFSNSFDGTSRNINSVIYWGSAGGFSSGNKTELPSIAAMGNSVADLNGDSFLDIVFSNMWDGKSYNINSVIYWGSAGGFSSGNKTELPTRGAIGNSVADLNSDGFLDIVFCNYYDDKSHNINSVIYWGSASGFSSGNKTELPTHGAYLSTTKDLGDAYTRLPEFVYISSAYDTGAASHLGALSWVAQIPPLSGNEVGVQFQIRTADTKETLTKASWYGPTGTKDRYTVSGTPINPIHSGGRWVQYRAFLKTNYANTPILDSVSIDIPTITAVIKAPAQNAYVRGVISVKGTANVGSGRTLQSWILDKARGENPDSGYLPLTVANQPVQDAELAQWDTTKEADGVYTLRLRVSDTEAVTVSDSVVVTVDNTVPPAPSVTINTQGVTGNYTRNKAILIFSGTAEPNVNVQSAKLLDQTDAPIADVKASLKADAAGNLSGSYTLGDLSGITSLKLSAIVQDRAGNSSKTGVSNSLTVDNEKPKISLLNPADFAYFNKAPIPFSGTASAALSGIAKVEINTGGGWVTVTGNVNWTYSFNPPIEDSLYIVQAKATDKAGNEEVTKSITVNYLTALPSANILQPADNATVSGTVQIYGTAEDIDTVLSDFSWLLEYAPGADATSGWKVISPHTHQVKRFFPIPLP